MTRSIPKLLIVEDEKNTREGIGRALKLDYHAVLAENAESALQILKNEKFQLILTDVKMPGMDGVSFVKEAQKIDPDLFCIVMTAYGTVETAVDAMKSGAYDFMIKPVKLDQVEAILQNAMAARERKLSSVVKNTPPAKTTALVQVNQKSPVIGQSRKMKEVMNLVSQIAPARSTVLLTGESGTGKEVIANCIHEYSDRINGPFVTVHCAALNANLLESELFGHEKGAFTNANTKKIGRFEAADGGTLFLDEIGEIDASTQVKLLRVLENRCFERVGGTETIHIDVRLVAATNKNLRKMVEDGEFREDLYYRLDVLNILLPPLHERKDDIPLLLNHFLQLCTKENNKSIGGFSQEALNVLVEYKWPGNVRELRNLVERMTILAKGSTIEIYDVPAIVSEKKPAIGSPETGLHFTPQTLDVSQNEKQLIIKALEETNNNKTAAAKKLGISRRTLHRRITELGL
ncbi:MAG: sigma-54 dependent transcriptional regulator [Lentisphaerales bacterium]|nr:sigma-54 dependent transcriptional regulator [Lentisphaerales bacterium]